MLLIGTITSLLLFGGTLWMYGWGGGGGVGGAQGLPRVVWCVCGQGMASPWGTVHSCQCKGYKEGARGCMPHAPGVLTLSPCPLPLPLPNFVSLISVLLSLLFLHVEPRLPACASLLLPQVAASDTALHLTGLTPSKYDNVVPPSVTLGAKATVRSGVEGRRSQGGRGGVGKVVGPMHMGRGRARKKEGGGHRQHTTTSSFLLFSLHCGPPAAGAPVVQAAPLPGPLSWP